MFESNTSDSRKTLRSIMAMEGMGSAAIVTTVVEEAEAVVTVAMAVNSRISNPRHRPP
jgi:hypothetical protein